MKRMMTFGSYALAAAYLNKQPWKPVGNIDGAYDQGTRSWLWHVECPKKLAQHF